MSLQQRKNFIYLFLLLLSLTVYIFSLEQQLDATLAADQDLDVEAAAELDVEPKVSVAKQIWKSPEQQDNSRFEFLQQDLATLKTQLADKESLVVSMSSEIKKLRKMTRSLTKEEKQMARAVAALDEKGMAVPPDNLAFITEIETERDMENIRNFVGSIHQYRTNDYDNLPFIIIYGSGLPDKFISEISFWHNVEYRDRSVFFNAATTPGTKLNFNHFTHILRILQLQDACRRYRNAVYLENKLTLNSETSTQIFINELKEHGAAVSKEPDFAEFQILGVSYRSALYNSTVEENLACFRKISSCDLAFDRIHALSKPVDYFLSNSRDQQNVYFCYINLRDDLMYTDFLTESVAAIDQTTGQANKLRIGVGVPTTSRRQTTKYGPIYDVFIPAFLDSITADECANFLFELYIGFDSDDPQWSNGFQSWDIKQNIQTKLSQYKCINVHYVQFPWSNSWLTYIWNRLYALSIKDGCDYFFQVNDDLKIETRGWATEFTQTLDLNNGFGVVGPFDPVWNCTILTQAMVSRKHYELFGFFYPLEIKDWYSDFWISRIYQPQDFFCSEGVVARNLREKGTRYQLCNRPRWATAIARDKIRVSNSRITAT